MRFESCIGLYKNKVGLIICAGATLKYYALKIFKSEILRNSLTIGVNNINAYIKPTYHLWTNNGRLKEFGQNISKESKLLLGVGINVKNIPIYHIDDFYGECIPIKYDYGFKNGTAYNFKYSYDPNTQYISGFFRTAGVLAIYIAYLMGVKHIYVVGMDGYGLEYNGDQHCYGKGQTDSDQESSAVKDSLVMNTLSEFHNIGIPFEIITPTVFNKFYNPEVLK